MQIPVLRNHREAIVAIDFFTVPTITFRVLYCCFVISHGRRRILHVSVTKHPTSGWIIQQLREAFPFGSTPKFLIYDRDARYGREVPAAVRSLEISPVQTSFRSPWQNGVAERQTLQVTCFAIPPNERTCWATPSNRMAPILWKLIGKGRMARLSRSASADARSATRTRGSPTK